VLTGIRSDPYNFHLWYPKSSVRKPLISMVEPR
jgi:hypothetical protein